MSNGRKERQSEGLLYTIRECLPILNPLSLIYNIYDDRNLTIIDRVHFAANDFRKGRVWPLSSSRLKYLWDQVCCRL